MSFFILFKKELKEQVKTHRMLIVAAVFFFFGLGTPLLINYLPVLVPVEESAIVLPEFTAVDAVEGYIDTAGQVGLIAAILIAMGSVARERELGTAAMTLSKPVGCGAFVSAKLAALTVTFATGIVIGALGCYIYTMILFGNVGAPDFIAANLLIGLYLLVCLAVTLMYSCIFKSQLAAGGLALVSLISLTATSGLPLMQDYSPGALSGWARRVATSSGPQPWGALIAGIVLIALTTLIGWQVLKRKEI